VKLVHLVGFIIKKFVRMYGHMDVKIKYVQILTHRVKFQITLEISREICPPVGNKGIISVGYQLPPFF